MDSPRKINSKKVLCDNVKAVKAVTGRQMQQRESPVQSVCSRANHNKHSRLDSGTRPSSGLHIPRVYQPLKAVNTVALGIRQPPASSPSLINKDHTSRPSQPGIVAARERIACFLLFPPPFLHRHRDREVYKTHDEDHTAFIAAFACMIVMIMTAQPLGSSITPSSQTYFITCNTAAFDRPT
jgi:hypothetical protein